VAVSRPIHQAQSKQKIGLEMATDNVRHQAEILRTGFVRSPVSGLRVIQALALSFYSPR
jgi:hypothetical protein